jgi:dTDP-4-dehydrorhamnose 3,5-epimerase
MRFTETRLSGCMIIDVEPIADERGHFARRFCAREFAEHSLPTEFVQSSLSFNPHIGTLRGLHFERMPRMEEKLVWCAAGAIFDVAVDLRPVSPSFGQWVGCELTATNHRQLYLPKGFAHGFITLKPDTVVSYQMAQFYEPWHSVGVRWNDPDIGVNWPIEPTLISERDAKLPLLKEAELH